MVINALAIFGNQIRGDSWSAPGKNLEYPLLKSMCMLLEVPDRNYSKGNPEGGDVLYARGTNTN